MSLKAFHVLFITVCTLFALGFSLWAVDDFRATGNSGSLVLAVLSFCAGVAMVVYGRWFLRKLKGESYL